METFYLTDTGIVRDHNEDSVIIVENNEATLLAVADGMGGHKAGEIASSIAISSISKRFSESFFKMTKAAAVEWIKTCANEINNQIFKYTEENPESKGMGTTLVLAIVTSEYILFGNIGDSSGFVMKDGKLHKVTKDHTLVNLLLAAGELTEEEAKNHPKKNILMNALGINDPIEIDIFDCSMEISEILLCSDGLTTMVSEDQIEKVLLEDTTTEEKVIKLIKKANNRGGNDNISIAYLKKDKGSELE
ncbi:MAG: Stp1/IreP family PP2C-type Ser/Thr phosphatase [Bacilli bacterium]|nr:Stp1/IreP family PP2C-type Ser/Thr phosphatase [Bacilli bacterium]